MLGADIDAARRIEEQQDAAFRQQPFGDGDLLLVAAGKRRHRASTARVGRPRRGRSTDATAAFSRSPSIRPKRHEAVDDRQGSIVLARKLEEQRLGLAVLGNEADADIGPHRVDGRAMTTGLPSTRSVPVPVGVMPKQARNRSSWPMPCSPATPRISPARSDEGGIAQLAGRAEPVEAASTSRPWRALAGGRGGKVWPSERPDDQAHHLGIAQIGDRCRSRCAGRCAGPSAYRRSARTSRRRCEMKTMVAPLAFSACDDLAQPIDVAPRQGRCRLVEQQDLAACETWPGRFRSSA